MDCANMMGGMHGMGGWMMAAGWLLWLLLVVLAALGIAALAKHLFAKPRTDRQIPR